MNTRKTLVVAAILIGIVILVACGPALAEPYLMPAATEAPLAEFAQQPAPVEAEKADASGGVVYETGVQATTGEALYKDRLIIKNAEIKLLVQNTDVSLDGVTQIVGDVQGYIISARIWYQDYYGQNYKYATLTMGVPADQFELALRRLRGLAVRVLDETASGEDVTDKYVDLQSRLRNLEVTRDRIQGFLEQAKTVDEALRINQELSNIEAQIEDTKGKINYYSNRAAYSTITVHLQPDLPPVVATPTPTLTPTPTPTLAPIRPLRPWDAGRTFQKAGNALIVAYRAVIDLTIWILMVIMPIFAPPVLIGWLIWRLVRRKSGEPPKKA